MKKDLYIVGTIVVIAGIGYLVYRKFFREPNITLNEIDWQNGTATMTIDGNVTQVTTQLAASVGNGYTVEMEKGFRADLNAQGAVNLVLKKNGSIVKAISVYQAP
jgi:hypothetical protein